MKSIEEMEPGYISDEWVLKYEEFEPYPASSRTMPVEVHARHYRKMSVMSLLVFPVSPDHAGPAEIRHRFTDDEWTAKSMMVLDYPMDNLEFHVEPMTGRTIANWFTYLDLSKFRHGDQLPRIDIHSESYRVLEGELIRELRGMGHCAAPWATDVVMLGNIRRNRDEMQKMLNYEHYKNSNLILTGKQLDNPPNTIWTDNTSSLPYHK